MFTVVLPENKPVFHTFHIISLTSDMKLAIFEKKIMPIISRTKYLHFLNQMLQNNFIQ